MYHASMKAKMSELEEEKSRLETIIKESPVPPALRLLPSLSQRYREMVEDLARSLNAPEVKREATASLQALMDLSRRKPILKNRVPEHVERAVIELAIH